MVNLASVISAEPAVSLETRLRLESFTVALVQSFPCPRGGGQKEQWPALPPWLLLLKNPSSLLSQERNKICYFPPPFTERRSNLVKADPFMRGSHVLRAMRPFSLSRAPCAALILLPGTGLMASPPKWSKDRLGSAGALWKALLISCAAAQQERAVSLQDLRGYIYITLKGHHLEQQETWHTPAPAACLPVESLFGPAW